MADFIDEPVLIEDEEIPLSFLHTADRLKNVVDEYLNAKIPVDGKPDPVKTHKEIIECLRLLNDCLSRFENYHFRE
jgi:hypothetical protein